MAQGAQATIRKGFVAGEFLTRTYRISGEVELAGEPIIDKLNNINTMFVNLERIFISPLLDPATLAGNYSHGTMRKDGIGVVVLNQAKDGLPYRAGKYQARDNVEREMLFVISGFEIRGVLTLHPTVNPIEFVRTTPEHFIPIFNGTVTVSTRRDIVFQGGAVLVNRNLLEVFCLAG